MRKIHQTNHIPDSEDIGDGQFLVNDMPTCSSVMMEW